MKHGRHQNLKWMKEYKLSQIKKKIIIKNNVTNIQTHASLTSIFIKKRLMSGINHNILSM